MTRIGLGRLGLEPAERYERERPGELIRIAIDDCTRLAFAGCHNHHRRHAALGGKPPIARLRERTNLLGSFN